MTSERIKKDIKLLEKNIKEMLHLDFSKEEKDIIQRAENYKEDSIYYLEKGDYITSFGCINYAHGLIDSLRILQGGLNNEKIFPERKQS